MIDPVWFVIPGKIRGKGRPRVAVRGKFARAYTDEKTVSAEAMVRDFASKAMAGRQLMSGAIKLSITIWLQRPKSWSAKKWIENPIPTGKPDLDNVAKLIGDALNGILWQDDSQIADLRICRLFVPEGAPERTVVMAGPITRALAVAA